MRETPQALVKRIGKKSSSFEPSCLFTEFETGGACCTTNRHLKTNI